MIREAKEKDLKGILEIYNDAILNTTAVYSYKAQTIEEKRKWYREKREKGYPILVFEENNIILGFATFGSFREWPAYKYTIEHSIYVHREHRNKGIANKLLNELIKIANENEYVTMVAGIDSLNEASIKMHRKIGFEYCGTVKRVGFKFGKWLNLDFYQLDLKGPKNPLED